MVGYGDGEMFIGSDALAVGAVHQPRQPIWRKATTSPSTTTRRLVFDADGEPRRTRRCAPCPASAALVEKGNYRHFMEKEIHDQPDACQHTLSAYLDPITRRATPPGDFDFTSIDRIQIVACGTAYYAGMIGKYLIESVAGLPVDVEVASEFRYRDPAVAPRTLAIAISQSGETADTLAALRWCKARGPDDRGHRQRPRIDHGPRGRPDVADPRRPGDRRASTKAFTAQVVGADRPGHRRRPRSAAGSTQPKKQRLVQILLEAPRLIAGRDRHRGRGAGDRPARSAKARDVLYLGRGAMFPLALEGALKLKEISYIHAEGYAAGELKHGPIALVDEATPVIVIAPIGRLVREDPVQHERGDRPRRQGDPDHRRGGRGARAEEARRDRRAHLRPADRAAGVRRADPAAGLSGGVSERRRRRPAAQPRQVGHGRVGGAASEEAAMNRVRKAVLPVAGLGTRMLPAAKTTPKNLLNVVRPADPGPRGGRGPRGGDRALRLRRRPRPGRDRGLFRPRLSSWRPSWRPRARPSILDEMPRRPAASRAR